MSQQDDRHEGDADTRQLTQLFAGYRESLPDPELGAQFMPQLWERIEAQRSRFRALKRLAQAFVTAAAAVSVLLAVSLGWPTPSVSPYYTSTYLELLASDQMHESDAELEIVRVEHISYESTR
jgi:hypothetical protein